MTGGQTSRDDSGTAHPEADLPELIYINGHDCALAAHYLPGGERLAVIVHGFPDDAVSMVPLGRRLHQAGFSVVMPYLRGQTPSGPAKRFGLRELSADILAIVDHLGAETATLIGHDWGAPAVYAATLKAPERVDVMVGMSVPPFRVWQDNIPQNLQQLRRSWYVGFFQVPGAPKLIRARRMRFIDHLWGAWSPSWTPDPRHIERVKARLAQPGVLERALSIYRHVVRELAVPLGARYRECAKLALGTIKAPSLLMTGELDQCCGVGMFDKLQGAFAKPVRFEVISAGHFLPLEATDACAKHIVEFAQGERVI